jgi:hypothetical protein
VLLADTVITIGPQAFAECSSLRSINIPNSVTEIGLQAFVQCTSLATVDIPTSVTTIAYGAFNGRASLRVHSCSFICQSLRLMVVSARVVSLKSIAMPDHFKELSLGLLAGCIALQSIELPMQLVSIHGFSLHDTGLLTISLPPNVAKVGQSAFISVFN